MVKRHIYNFMIKMNIMTNNLNINLNLEIFKIFKVIFPFYSIDLQMKLRNIMKEDKEMKQKYIMIIKLVQM